MDDTSVRPVTIALRSVTLPDPQDCTDNAESLALLEALFDALVRRGRDGGYEPALAEHRTLSDDACTWRFVLRERLTFHNGQPIDAEVMRASIARMQRPDVGATLGAPAVWGSTSGVPQSKRSTGGHSRSSRPNRLPTCWTFWSPAMRFHPIWSTSRSFRCGRLGADHTVSSRGGRTAISWWSAIPLGGAGKPPIRHCCSPHSRRPSPGSGSRKRTCDGRDQVHADRATTSRPHPGPAHRPDRHSLHAQRIARTMFRPACPACHLVGGGSWGLDRKRSVWRGSAAPRICQPCSSRGRSCATGGRVRCRKGPALLEEAGFGEGLTLEVDCPTRLPDEALTLTTALTEQLAPLGITLKRHVVEDRVAYAEMVRAKDIHDMCLFDSSPISTFRVLYEKSTAAKRARGGRDTETRVSRICSIDHGARQIPTDARLCIGTRSRSFARIRHGSHSIRMRF